MEADFRTCPVIERRFGHCLIEWTISNFCFETSGRSDFKISTPKFFVDGLHSTKWKMTLDPRGKIGSEEAFYLIVERTACDIASEISCVDLNVCIADSEGKSEMLPVRYRNEFENCDPHVIPLWSVGCIRESLEVEAFALVKLKIRCQVIVDFEDCFEYIDGPKDIGLKTLSEDLMNLYKNGTCRDITLRCKGGKILAAHKAILYPKSTFFAGCIKPGIAVLDLLDVDYDVMRDIVEYFYSGNMNYVAWKPSVLMYEYAMRFDIPQIRHYYDPQGLQVESVIDVSEHTFEWTARNLGGLQGVRSDLLPSDYIDAVLQISLCYDNDFLTVCVEAIEGVFPKNGCFQVFMTDGDGDEIFFRRTKFPETIDTHSMKFERCLERNEFTNILRTCGDTVTVTVKIEIHGNQISSNERYTMSHLSSPIDVHYMCLSLCGSFIFEKDLFADVTLEVEGKFIRANKCILSARSPVLEYMLKQTQGDRLVILNIRHEVLHAVICYLYTGILKKVEHDIFEVYKAAHYLSLSYLKKICLAVLKDNIDMQSVCDALIFSEEFEDTELRSLTFDFIRQNKSRFLDESSWKFLFTDKPVLCSLIVETCRQKEIL